MLLPVAALYQRESYFVTYKYKSGYRVAKMHMMPYL